MMCEWGHGRCTAPDTKCIHWMGTFCELDQVFYYRLNLKRGKENKAYDNRRDLS